MNIRRAGDSQEQRERRSFHGRTGNGEGEVGFQASTSAAWDPYEVWLTRVKQPREEIERGRARSSLAASGKSATDDSPGGLHPILHR